MYCDSLSQYKRRKSHAVKVGDVQISSEEPIVVQTMTSTATSDVEGSVEQIIRTIKAGAQIVRVTVPAMRDIEHLAKIKDGLRARGITVPLVADIHFNQKIAFEAAKIVEKVRINPGNFADSKKFQELDYSTKQYEQELGRVKEAFLPLIELCKKHGTALRIGTNHGSLSDRIMSRYGDTPQGMAESAMEFIRICHEHNFADVVISMKASNTLVMVQATRLLTSMMKDEGLTYPLHLGVTEAGEGEDGRIKSALGIGALLADGIGDTIRVSLTEDPEFEIPVAKKIVEHFSNISNHAPINDIDEYFVDPYTFKRRESEAVLNVGGANVPVVISSCKVVADSDLVPDYLFANTPVDNTKIVSLLRVANTETIATSNEKTIPLCDYRHPELSIYSGSAFVEVNADTISKESIEALKALSNKVVVLQTANLNVTAALRSAIVAMCNAGIKLPVILKRNYEFDTTEDLQLIAAAELGALQIDGLCDGIWIENNGSIQSEDIHSTMFGILQASRMRVSKPDYISCPSCGRTQFNIQATTKLIRSKTAHLKGLKIGIMGCVVNGLGEMADADYGYIGGAPGKVNLYHKKVLIKRSVDEKEAVDELINLIKQNDDWHEPK